MKLKLSKEPFLKALGLVVSVINPKNPLPILSNLLIETVGKDEVKITATDLEIGVSTTAPAQVSEEGSITVPAKKLFDIVREMPPGEFDLQITKNNSVHIRSSDNEKGSQFKIMGLPKDDYPKLIEYSLEEALTISQKILKECLTLTVFAISRDETRYVLNGALFILKGKTIKVISTDGRRLAYIKREVEKNTNPDFEVIVPAKTINELLKLLGDEGTVKIVLVRNQIVFDFGKTYLISRLIEGHFPNYEQVIPKEEKATAKLLREGFLQAVKRASLLTSQESQSIKIEFMKNKLAISSRSPNLGEAREEFPAELDGEDIMIGFNPTYLMDVLKNVDSESVILSLSGSDRPGVIKGKDDYLYVVMPMQLVN
jgi:DNA polymerase-3 subunit beta